MKANEIVYYKVFFKLTDLCTEQFLNSFAIFFQCHYSIGKGVAFMGMGLDNLINVKTDANGKMIPEDLEKKILEAKAEGKTPYFVNATAGTTVFGAFDPIDEIADICQKYNLWMHVDGAWGGGALLSKTYSPLLKGVERADSMTWNPHKLMGVPQQCSLVFTKHKVQLCFKKETLKKENWKENFIKIVKHEL